MLEQQNNTQKENEIYTYFCLETLSTWLNKKHIVVSPDYYDKFYKEVLELPNYQPYNKDDWSGCFYKGYVVKTTKTTNNLPCICKAEYENSETTVNVLYPRFIDNIVKMDNYYSQIKNIDTFIENFELHQAFDFYPSFAHDLSQIDQSKPVDYGDWIKGSSFTKY